MSVLRSKLRSTGREPSPPQCFKLLHFSHTDRLISELGILTGNKTKLESCNTDLNIVKETLEEVLDAINTNTREITAQLATLLNAGCALSGTSENISAIKTQLSAITALLKEALKVFNYAFVFILSWETNFGIYSYLQKTPTRH